ncbi:helix-turn-helix domain-containing protein [Jutongia sp.]
MTIKEIRDITGLSQVEFGKKYDIPRRTIQNWETGERQCPPYMLKLLERVVKEDYSCY